MLHNTLLQKKIVTGYCVTVLLQARRLQKKIVTKWCVTKGQKTAC